MESQVDAGSFPPESREHPLSHSGQPHPPLHSGLALQGEGLLVLLGYLTPANSCNLVVVSTLCPHYLSFHLVRRQREAGELVSAVLQRHQSQRPLCLSSPWSHLRHSLTAHLNRISEKAFRGTEGV